MVKVHTRRKRKFIGIHIPRNRSPGPKSFTTIEKALAYAEQNGIKNAKVRNLRVDEKNTKPKYIIVM